MKGFKQMFRLFLPLICLGFILGGLVSGCSSAGTDGASMEKGSVALLFTDGPTDEFNEVNVTVNEVSLLSEDQAPVVIFSGAQRINLLALQDQDDLFMVRESVPAGFFFKIRLQISNPCVGRD